MLMGRAERQAWSPARPPASLPFQVHRTPLEAQSKFSFCWQIPFCQAGLSCFLLPETKNVLIHLFSHCSVLTASHAGWPQWRRGQGREGREGLMGPKCTKSLSQGSQSSRSPGHPGKSQEPGTMHRGHGPTLRAARIC